MLKKQQTVSLFLIVSMVCAHPLSAYAETRQECLDRCASEYNTRIQSAMDQLSIDRQGCDAHYTIDTNAANAQLAICLSGASSAYLVWVLACGTSGPGVPICVAAATAAYLAAQGVCAATAATQMNQANLSRTACYATADQTYQNAIGSAQALRETCEQGCPAS
jgi:hypothetical protein